MPTENVAATEASESLEDVANEAAPEATPASDDAATLKKRLAGKDQALTRIQQERDALKAERDAMARWKAEREEADLTEVEKLQKRLAEYEERATAAEQRAERIRLEKSYPLAVEFYGDDPLPSEERLEALQQRLAAASATGDDDEPEPRVDPNKPRRTPATGTPLADKSGDDLAKSLRDMPNPFLDSVWT